MSEIWSSNIWRVGDQCVLVKHDLLWLKTGVGHIEVVVLLSLLYLIERFRNTNVLKYIKHSFSSTPKSSPVVRIGSVKPDSILSYRDFGKQCRSENSDIYRVEKTCQWTAAGEDTIITSSVIGFMRYPNCLEHLNT